jgi:hypothetical protein
MKRTYETPKITILGTIEEITQAFGSSSAADALYIGGTPLPSPPGGFGFTGSRDGQVVPR